MKTFTVPLDELYEFASPQAQENYIFELCQKHKFNTNKDFTWHKDFQKRIITFTQKDDYLN